MTITVNTPDGGTAEFPDGTDPGTITSAMKAKFGGPDTTSDSKPLFSLTGTDKVGEFVGKVADAATAGFGASALDKLGLGQGPGGQTVAKQVESAGQDIGPVGSAIADATGYGLGLGKFGIAGRIAKAALPGAEAVGLGARTAGALGTAGEAGIATTAGDIGHGETPGMDVPLSMGVGGALGAAIGGARTAPPAARSVADLTADEAAKYANLKTMPVNPTMVNRGVASAVKTLDPSEISGLSGSFKQQFSDVIKQVNSGLPLSANDMNSMARQLGAAQRGGTDSIAGARIGEVLRSFYSDPQADARLASAKVKDMGWLTDPDLTPAEKVAQAKSNINDPGMLMDDPTRAAMTNLANAGPGKWAQRAQNLVATGINAGVKMGLGGAVGDAFGEGGLGAVIGALEGKSTGGLGGALARYPSNAAIKRAIQAAQAATSTGQAATPGMYRSPWPARGAQAALPVVYGVGAAGQ